LWPHDIFEIIRKSIKMKKTYQITLFFLLFFTYFAQSQGNYQSGYLLSNSGDTLRGLIDYNKWENNPEVILFKKSNDDPQQKFNPLSIKGFGVDAAAYQSAIVQTRIWKLNSSNLSYEKNFETKLDTVFLEALIKGTKGLYLLKKTNLSDQFYIKEGDKFDLLIFHTFLKKQNDKDIVTENNKYVGQLSFYLQDCANIQSELKGLKYAKSSLEKLFLNYYKCTQSKAFFQNTADKIERKIGILAGLTASTVDFKSEFKDYIYLAKANFSTSVRLTLGAYWEIDIFRKNKRWTLPVEVMLTSYGITGKFDNIINPEYYQKYDSKLSLTYLKANTQLRYIIPIKKSSIFLNSGLSVGYVIASRGTLSSYNYTYGREDNYKDPLFKDSRSFELGFLAGLGFKKGRFTYEIRNEIGNGMASSVILKSTSIRWHGLVGYHF
jgi:hypothetical protein